MKSRKITQRLIVSPDFLKFAQFFWLNSPQKKPWDDSSQKKPVYIGGSILVSWLNHLNQEF